MLDEVRSADIFYDTSAGAGVVRLLARRLTARWTDVRGLDLLGLGCTAPFLSGWREQATLTVAARPDVPQEEALRRHQADCIVSGSHFPFPDLSFDRILMVHALETAPSGRDLLRSVWKVLRDNGRLIVIVPNRRGLWALSDTTPFGQGTPYSQRQVRRLLQEAMFHVETCETALYPPLFPLLRSPRLSTAIERAGETVLPACGGVVILEAVKNLWGGVPLTVENRTFSLGRRLVKAR
ncbi:class I SAM-dependent methyltransferase [Acetobacter sp.]|jgi:SAM-dependent methyltransferase|uniref:class I SAM-dependent methyltransferase n=1 Tax=Acetobacter sp. TaxID=440 RepID=UPI0025C4A76C|nr:methyltransferase domain-containing protein [Acetobacter sp.]MCH4090940.1 class I SAM-dependent methyltransferase [Acetobacter sp.]MCI1300781.1 class I SAM-dependent methyltransferase [Acetobacter sp.]MCI1317114.1 class I SAM-dependent methyltransferase [Acetobacter sp.]